LIYTNIIPLKGLVGMCDLKVYNREIKPKPGIILFVLNIFFNK